MAIGQQELRSESTVNGSSRLGLWIRIVAVLLAVGLPIQAFLGSEGFLKANDTSRDMHEMFGNFFFLFGIAQIVLGYMGMKSGLVDRTGIVLRVVFFVLVIVQISLGYGGRDELDMRVYHIPNGVLLMGLAGIIAAQSFKRPSN